MRGPSGVRLDDAIDTAHESLKGRTVDVAIDGSAEPGSVSRANVCVSGSGRSGSRADGMLVKPKYLKRPDFGVRKRIGKGSDGAVSVSF